MFKFVLRQKTLTAVIEITKHLKTEIPRWTMLANYISWHTLFKPITVTLSYTKVHCDAFKEQEISSPEQPDRVVVSALRIKPTTTLINQLEVSFTWCSNVTGRIVVRPQWSGWRLPKSVAVTLPIIRAEAIVSRRLPLASCVDGAYHTETLPQCVR